MGLCCGMIGLPNVGKTTVFNALTGSGALAANYPFATVDPNTGIAPVPDPRLIVLTDLFKSKKTTYSTLEVRDIAGLVEGASKGEGLGNQFLGHIREVDALLHVVRCFQGTDVANYYPRSGFSPGGSFSSPGGSSPRPSPPANAPSRMFRR
ncbi:MAG: hypothetical protein E8D41_12460 [Nitrospira sp.]|nr:MAG: hypothetical protein E8D41_12460 [Nitrospira sp.]